MSPSLRIPVVMSAPLLRRSPDIAAYAIQQALKAADGSIGEAAKQLGASYSSVQRWIRDLRGRGYLFEVRARGAKMTPAAVRRAKPQASKKRGRRKAA